ncbi:uncharacterized protein LOC142169190 [Nicotiana tabacum]|uniref:Uncharacterized protein LOC142169190 n=1 Tax=Nicotiana tabacum TaxID=4097 RepID=A0AC58SNH3_TOBAC
MVNARKIDRYKRIPGYQSCFSNCANKIWIFWSSDYVIDILEDREKHVLLRISNSVGTQPFYISAIYAKYDETLRYRLWEELRDLASWVNGPRGVVGDFNVVSCEEKKGGRPFRVEDSLDFLACLSDCGLQDAGYCCSQFTWSDNRDPPNTIWERLDRLVYNAEWFDSFGSTVVTHLSRSCSDHAPLLISAANTGSDFKLKKVCSTLSAWSRQAFGDIYEEPKRLEALIRSLEEEMISDPSPECRMNLSKAIAKFTIFLKLRDSILRQKVRVKWLTYGDDNTTFFHAVIKDRRKKLNIQRIRDDNDNLMEGTEEVAGAVVRFFQQLFGAEITIEDLIVLDVVKRTVTEEDNAFLTEIPLKRIVPSNLLRH